MDGSELRVALPLAGDQQFDETLGHATAAITARTASDDGQQLTVTYRLTPPSAGWGSGDRAAIAYAPARFEQDDDTIAWVGAGSLSLRPAPDLTATVLSDPLVAPVAQHAFQIVFESRSKPMDRTLVERTIVRIGLPMVDCRPGQFGRH